MPGKHSRLNQKAAFILTFKTRCQSSSAISKNPTSGRIAALWTNTSTHPFKAIACVEICLQLAASPTSPMATIALTPNFSASAATPSHAARSFDPFITTSKPSAAKAKATARPIFRPDPVINTVLVFCAISNLSLFVINQYWRLKIRQFSNRSIAPTDMI